MNVCVCACMHGCACVGEREREREKEKEREAFMEGSGNKGTDLHLFVKRIDTS